MPKPKLVPSVVEYLSVTLPALPGRSEAPSPARLDFKDDIDGATLERVLELIQEIKDRLPAGAYDARFDFDQESIPYSNDQFERVWVSYRRNLTEDEIKEEAKREAEHKAAQTTKLRAEIARLQGLLGEG